MVRLGEAKAVAEILETSMDMLTMRTDEARTIEYLADLIRRAKDSYRVITAATDELLQALETLQANAEVVAEDSSESPRIRELVADAHEVQKLTPEGAVVQ